MIARLTRLMGVERPVRVLMSSLSDTPSVVGWLRPVILLPAATCLGLTPLQLEAVLAHEIGHIKRYDYLVNLIQMMVETVLFYHPAVWWTSKRIRLERELCCDDLAVRFSGNALRYARALSTLEKLRLRAPGVAMAGTGGPLLYRIQRLAGIRAQEYAPSRLPAALAIGLGVVCFALNVHWLRGQDAPGVKVDLGSSAVIHRSPVAYPEAARKQSLSGTVQLEVTLDTAGNVADAHVLAGPEELRKPALKSVLDWHFTRDAAGSTRLINISFSGEARQVQVLEPSKAVRAAADDNRPGAPAAVEIELKQFASRLKIAAAEAAEFQKIGQAGIQELTRRQQLEREMADARKQIELARNSEAESAERLKIKLIEMQREFNQTPFPGKISPVVMAGRALKRIDVSDLPDAVRDDLVSHLPVREGDILSRDSIEETAKALRAFDEHLKVQLRPTDDGQAEIRIVAPR